jgi:hypothetical protein
MAAYIDQRLDVPFVSLDDDAGFNAQIHDEIIAGARQAAGVADTEPMPQEDAVHVELKYTRVGVKFARECMPGRMPSNESRDIEGHVEVWGFDVGSAHGESLR